MLSRASNVRSLSPRLAKIRACSFSATARIDVIAASPGQEIRASFRSELHRGMVKLSDATVLFRCRQIEPSKVLDEKNSQDDGAESYHNHAIRSNAASALAKIKKYFVPHGHFRPGMTPSLMRAANGREKHQ
jgi:hypothetical protein